VIELLDEQKQIIKIYLELKSRKEICEFQILRHSKQYDFRYSLDLEELGEAFDHIMHCMVDEFSENQKEQLKNVMKHIEKAIYDFLDILNILISKDVKRIDNFTSDVISKVLPNYFIENTSKMRKAKEDISIYRNERSLKNIEKYLNALKTMGEINQEIEKHLPDMARIQKENKKSFIWQTILVPLIIGLILLVAGIFIGKLV
jgi:hypothetical protein